MNGKIIIKDNHISCNVVGCNSTAKFKWFFRRDQNRKLLQVGSVSNIINYMGIGDYICEVTCGDNKVNINANLNPGEIRHIINYADTIQPSNPTPSYKWDYSKIPEQWNEEIIKFVAQDNRKRLAMLHNDLQLSENYYCCGELSEVIENFKEYVESLSGTKG